MFKAIFVSFLFLLNVLGPSVVQSQQGGGQCVPICFRSKKDDRSDKINLDGQWRVIGHAQMQSSIFDATWVAFEHNQECSLSSRSDFRTCRYGSAERNNRGVAYIRKMHQVTTQTFGTNVTADLKMLIIGHGLGYLPFLLQNTFSNAYIDTMDIDSSIFKISGEWFCFDRISARNPRVKRITYDGIRFIKELYFGPKNTAYDVIHLDVFDSCQLIPFFQSEWLFRMLQFIWRRWDEEAQECRPRLVVMNAFYPDSNDLRSTVAFKNAVKVFGNKQVKAHSNVIMSVRSQCEHDGSRSQVRFGRM